MKNIFIREVCNNLNELADECYSVAKSKGFHDKPVEVATMVANLHGEVSELWEAYRKQDFHKLCDKADKMVAHGIEPLTCAEEELADILIRVLDTAKEYNVDIGKAVFNKHEFNKTRSHRNGGKIA